MDLLASLVGLLMGPLTVYFPIYLIIFIVRKVKARKFGPGAGPSIITPLLYAFAMLMCFSMIMPRFMTFASKARESEAKMNLASIATAQINYYTENKNYPGMIDGKKAFEIMGWAPEGRIFYAYYCGDETIPPSDPERPYPKLGAKWPYPILPQVSPTGFTCLAAGNIDVDEFFDVWMINDKKYPIHLYDDVGDLTLYGKSKSELWFEQDGLTIIALALIIPLLFWSAIRDGVRYKAALAAAKTSGEKSEIGPEG